MAPSLDVNLQDRQLVSGTHCAHDRMPVMAVMHADEPHYTATYSSTGEGLGRCDLMENKINRLKQRKVEV